MTMGEQLTSISFATVYKDLDSPSLGCTNQIPACHGGATPTGMMALDSMAGTDMTKLMASYNQVKMRTTVSDPSSSLIVKKPLATAAGGVAHVGGNGFFKDTNDAVYKRWLLWIQLGAQFESVSVNGGQSADMAMGGG
jgi:hypothetical protein